MGTKRPKYLTLFQEKWTCLHSFCTNFNKIIMNRGVVSLCSEFILPHASECMVGCANRIVVTSQTKAATKIQIYTSAESVNGTKKLSY